MLWLKIIFLIAIPKLILNSLKRRVVEKIPSYCNDNVVLHANYDSLRHLMIFN